MTERRSESVLTGVERLLNNLQPQEVAEAFEQVSARRVEAEGTKEQVRSVPQSGTTTQSAEVRQDSSGLGTNNVGLAWGSTPGLSNQRSGHHYNASEEIGRYRHTTLNLKQMNLLTDTKFEPLNPIEWMEKLVREGRLLCLDERVIITAVVRKIPYQFDGLVNTINGAIVEGTLSTVAQLSELFRKKFLTPTLKKTKIDQLYFLKQERGTSTEEFIQTYKWIYNQTGQKELREDMLVEGVQSKLHPDVQVRLLPAINQGEHLSVARILELAKEAEQAWEIQGAYHFRPKKREQEIKEESAAKRTRVARQETEEDIVSMSDSSEDEVDTPRRERKRKGKDRQEGTKKRKGSDGRTLVAASSSSGTTFTLKCYGCNKSGHLKRDCPEKKTGQQNAGTKPDKNDLMLELLKEFLELKKREQAGKK